MPLSGLVQALTSQSVDQCLESIRAQMSVADALTLRRVALLAILERWEVASLHAEILDIVIRRDEPKELSVFLASSHLTKYLSESGVLGRALAQAAENGRVYVTSVLAPRVSEVERNRAALRAANVGQHATLECLLRACKSEVEEISMLRACLVTTVSSGIRPFVSLVVNALKCAGQTQVPMAAMLVAASRGFDDICREMLTAFSWLDEDKAKLAAFGIVAPEGSAIITENVDSDDSEINEDDASLITNKRGSTAIELVSAVERGHLNVLTSLLKRFNWTMDNLRSGTVAAAERGNLQALSRLILAIRERYLATEQEVDELLGQALIIGSRLGHTIFARSLAYHVKDEESRCRALYCACLEGKVDTVVALLESGLNMDAQLLEQLIIASAAKGHQQVLVRLKQRFPEHEQIILDVARHGLARAARTNDSVLAESCVSLLDAGSLAGGSATAATIVAKRHGYEDVVLALKPLQRGVSNFTNGNRDLISLDDDVFDRILSFLDLSSLGTVNVLCKRFAGRKRITEQFARCLLSDFQYIRNKDGAHSLPHELTRLAVVITSSSVLPQAFEREAKAKAHALDAILSQAVHDDWDDIGGICSELFRRSADADLASTVETLLQVKTKDGATVISGNDVRNAFKSVIKKERLKALSVICRIAIPDGRLSTRALVEESREEANNGNASTLFLMMAALSRQALTSRRERDALWARRRLEWERRGGIWGALQQEEERNSGKTPEERDWDDAVGGTIRRAGAAGHREIVSSIIKMLRARGRLREFGLDFEKAFEGACRGGYHELVSDLLANVPFTEAQLEESLVAATRNGQLNVARIIVMDGRLPLSVVRSKFVDAARRGHIHAIQTLMATGAIGAVTCADALEEAIRREHEECKEYLERAHQRLVEFEEAEGRLR